MKNKLIIVFFLLLNFSGFSQIVRTLSNVSNTTDTLKPISNAQKTAINQKLQTVSSISALQSFTDANFAYLDGSTWEKKTGNVTSNGGSFAGTLIRVSSTVYWERKIEGKISAKYFGLQEGNIDNTVGLTNAITYISNYNTNQRRGSLTLPKGTYKCNLDLTYVKVNLVGDAENATVLTPFDNTKPVVILADDASWDRMTIRDITFQGVDLTSVGIQFGHTIYQTNDEYSGRTNIDNCKFITFDKCISRRNGNIGIYINNCTFGTANYHLWGQSITNMQVGVTHVQNCHFDNANLASVYIKSGVSGDGQFIFNTCVFENNTGFILFIDTYTENDFVPEFTFENCWNEVNATATSVTIAGNSYAPRFGYLKNVSNISFINSPVSTLTLINSNCLIERSDISFLSVTKDSQSFLMIDKAVLESAQTQEFVKSIKSSIRPAGNSSSYFASYHRTILNKIYSSNIKLSIPFNTTYSFTGSHGRNTVAVSNDGTTYANCESLTVNSGETLVSTTNTTIQPSKYYVYTLSYKLTSGLAPNFVLTENTALMPSIPLKSSKWTTICGLISTFGVSGLPATVRTYFTPATSGSSTVYLGGFQLLEFDNQQEAMDFLDSRTFAN